MERILLSRDMTKLRNDAQYLIKTKPQLIENTFIIV